MSTRDTGIRASRFARPLLDDDALSGMADLDAFYDAIQRVEDQIKAKEGDYHVEGRYYANAWDADCQRQWAAERMVRERARGGAA